MTLKLAILGAIAAACSSTPGTGANSHAGGNGAGGAATSSPAMGGNTAPTGGGQTLGGDRASGGADSTIGGASGELGAGGSSHNLGGSVDVGGNAFAGGALASGGVQASGGTQPIGGTHATGATQSLGGATGAGGTLVAVGGSSAKGGTQATGGQAANGGTQATGGRAASGGMQAGGGTAPMGGAGAIGGNSSTSTARTKFSVYIAGDSTVSTYTLTSSTKDQAGWGQMLQQYYDSNYVTVVNKAVGGMTARHFIQAGNLDAILTLLKAGDYFLVQFGTNDSNTTATYTINGVSYPYFADANTDFKTYLQQYIDGAKAKGATPVLVTPPPRNSAYCNGGRSMASYAQAMLDLGKADNVAVVDLSMKAWTYLSAICPKPTDGTTENFFKVNSDNTIDGTHFQEDGAIKLAGFVADGIGEAGLGLDAYRVK